MDERRNQFIVGSVIVVVVIVVITLIAMKGGGDLSCELQVDKPNIDLTKVKTVSSAENNALLRLAGYVKYEIDPKSENKKAYLALDGTNSVALKKGDKEGANSVEVDTDCASISISIAPSAQSDKLEIGTINLVLRANVDVKSCSVSFGAVYPKDKHYSCNKDRSYPCTIKKKDSNNKEIVTTVATLSLVNLEFEINGNPDKVKKGEFTTSAEECI